MFVLVVKIPHHFKVICRLFILFALFVGDSTTQVSFNEDVDFLNVGRAVDRFRAVFDLFLFVLIAPIAESNVVENGCLVLIDLFLVEGEVLI